MRVHAVIDDELFRAAQQACPDAAEQAHPHVRGDRVVWTDYSADPDRVYREDPDPAENNGDILGYDLAADAPLVVTQHPSKQIRPAIDQEIVVWMDWRGIQPEPKYSELKVYAIDLTAGVEIHLATSSWTQPELWRRPGVSHGFAAWIEQPTFGDVASDVVIAPVDGGAPIVVDSSSVPLQAVDLTDDAIGWVGPSELWIKPLDSILP